MTSVNGINRDLTIHQCRYANISVPMHSFDERIMTICPPEQAFQQMQSQCFTPYNSGSFQTGSRLTRCMGQARWYW
jgi:hypothetical protein